MDDNIRKLRLMSHDLLVLVLCQSWWNGRKAQITLIPRFSTREKGRYYARLHCPPRCQSSKCEFGYKLGQGCHPAVKHDSKA